MTKSTVKLANSPTTTEVTSSNSTFDVQTRLPVSEVVVLGSSGKQLHLSSFFSSSFYSKLHEDTSHKLKAQHEFPTRNLSPKMELPELANHIVSTNLCKLFTSYSGQKEFLESSVAVLYFYAKSLLLNSALIALNIALGLSALGEGIIQAATFSNCIESAKMVGRCVAGVIGRLILIASLLVITSASMIITAGTTLTRGLATGGRSCLDFASGEDDHGPTNESYYIPSFMS